MILKLGMYHWGLQLYKVYINHDPRMILAYFMARSTLVTFIFEWGETVTKSLNDKKNLQ